MKKSLEQRKKELVEKVGVHFEELDQFAPVASRILAYIILNGKKGTTFDQLVTNLCASKSTISTHLTHLQNLNKVHYYTKSGDRKKYFVINKDSIIQNIDKLIEGWQSKKRLHQEVKKYKEEYNKTANKNPDERYDLEFHDDFITFLDQTTNSVLTLREKLIKKNQQEKQF